MNKLGNEKMKKANLRVVVWGVGKNLTSKIDKICLDDIQCLIDSDIEKQGRNVWGKIIYAPSKIPELKYDYIVISSGLYFKEISRQLLFQYGVECSKILCLKGFLQMGRNAEMALLYGVKKMCVSYRIHKVLDIGGVLGKGGYWNTNEDIDLGLLLSKEQIPDFLKRKYSSVYTDVEHLTDSYELTVDTNMLKDEEWVYVLPKADNIIKPIMYTKGKNIIKESDENTEIFNIYGIHMAAISRRRKKVCIYQVTHKKFIPVRGLPYKPIHAGKAGKANLGYRGDDEGDNISKLNGKINECTALYWIWKNDDSDFIGLNHYRRLFSSAVNPGWMLQDFEVQILLEQYDMIVAEGYETGELSVLESMRYGVCPDALNSTYKVLKDIFKNMGESQYQTFCYVMNGYKFNPCNMFIASRKIVEEYCEWLFPILFKVIECVEICEEWDAYSKRIIGFFAERLLTVWIVQNNYKIKELPILFLEKG